MKRFHWVSALRQPLAARVPIRRSSALMAVLFVGLGVLWLNVKTNPSGASHSGQTSNTVPPGYVITPVPGTSTTTPTPSATTTPSTTVASSATTRAPNPTTSTTVVVHSPSTTTAATTATTTTTVPGG